MPSAKPVSKASNARRQAAPPAPRAWQRMLSGRRLDLLDPSPFDVEIEDIAHGLARVARWNGQTQGAHAFSVAQHSLLVERFTANLKPGLSVRDRMLALLHDAPEYVIGDMISPFKAALGLDYRAFEERLAAAVHVRFGLPAEPPAWLKQLIKQADRMSAYLEAVQLAGFTEAEARSLFLEPPPELCAPLEPLSTPAAQADFLQRFEVLMKLGAA